MDERPRNTLSAAELAGFALVAGAFVALMAMFDLEPQSWASFALLAAFMVLLVAYRLFLRARRRRADG